MDMPQGGDKDRANDATRAEKQAASIRESSSGQELCNAAPADPPSAPDRLEQLDAAVNAVDGDVDDGLDAGWGRFKEATECTRVALEMDASFADLESVRAWAFRAPVSLKREEEIELQSCTMIDVSHAERTSEIHALLNVADGNLYHGQVEEVEELQMLDGETKEGEMQLRPHGYGVWTKPDSSKTYGQWAHGIQIGFGSLQVESGVRSYEGECQSGNATGYGVGLFANGIVFAGSWRDGRPYGLGRLQQQDPALLQYGWFYGTRCVQPCDVEPLLNPLTIVRPHRLRFARQADVDQPTRGLRLVGTIVDDARIDAFRRALRHWRHECCAQAVLRAKRCRVLAVATRQRALRAQQSAVQADLSVRTNRFHSKQADIVSQVGLTRQTHARVQRIRALHVQRRAEAEHQCALAKTCVATQNEAIELMEMELEEVLEALVMAKTAQSDCRQLSHQLHVLKRQIENICVKINALKVSEQNQQQQSNELARSVPSTPWTASENKIPSSKGAVFVTGGRRTSSADPEATVIVQRLVLPEFVCDVPGCDCGIPRNVFLRAGAALNGD